MLKELAQITKGVRVLTRENGSLQRKLTAAENKIARLTGKAVPVKAAKAAKAPVAKTVKGKVAKAAPAKAVKAAPAKAAKVVKGAAKKAAPAKAVKGGGKKAASEFLL